MMEKRIKIFKSFEEQEEYQLNEMRKTTPQERFQNLYRMQQISKLFRPIQESTNRRIIIEKNGYSE